MSYTPVVIVNAPPNAGKDTAAKIMAELMEARSVIDAQHLEFKSKLFDLVLCMFDADHDKFFDLYNNRETKELPTPLLNGMSPRQAMIFASEQVIKPNFSKDYFGQSAAKRIKPGFNVFSDGGFMDEIKPVYDVASEIIVLKLTRPECTFTGDSRDYINEEEATKLMPNIQFYHIDNDKDMIQFESKLWQFLIHWFDEVII